MVRLCRLVVGKTLAAGSDPSAVLQTRYLELLALDVLAAQAAALSDAVKQLLGGQLVSLE